MAQTVIRGTQILNNTVQRQDLDTSTVGQAVVTKIVQGSGITLSSTGADSGTGDVTITSPDVVSTDAGNIATLGTDNHILVPQSQIWSVRLRSFNAIGNPTFEVDQRTVGTGAPTANSFALDRWYYTKAGTMTFSVLAQQDASASPILLPGTNFALSQNFLRFTLGTQESVLGASDKVALYQFVEGQRLRELIADVHSLQLLARSSVAGLSFGVSLQDVAGTRTLVKLATIPSAATWTLIPLANLPVWPAGTTWSLKPGVQGYFLGICLAAGSTVTAAANNTWQNANVVGALGQSNFAAQTVGSTFDLAYISHEPGAQASNPPIDCPFQQNYDDCLRYFTKSYGYTVKPGTADATGCHSGLNQASQNPYYWYLPFKKTMAKIPSTVTGYSPATGAINNVRNISAGADLAITASANTGDSAFTGFAISSPPASLWGHQFHYTADTGW